MISTRLLSGSLKKTWETSPGAVGLGARLGGDPVARRRRRDRVQRAFLGAADVAAVCAHRPALPLGVLGGGDADAVLVSIVVGHADGHGVETVVSVGVGGLHRTRGQ